MLLAGRSCSQAKRAPRDCPLVVTARHGGLSTVMSMKPSPAPTPPDPLSDSDAVVDVSSLDSEARASFEAYGSGIAVGAVQLRRAHAGVIAHVGGGTRLRPEREAAERGWWCRTGIGTCLSGSVPIQRV